MYDTPTPEELKKFMADNNLTGADLSALTGVNDRSARRWVQPPKHKGAAPIPWAAWAVILILTGKKTKQEIIKLVSQWKKEKKGRGLYERGNAGRPKKEEK